MFNGIVETTGIIKSVKTNRDCFNFNIVPEMKFSDIKIGDSISVNGVCLTITSCNDYDFNTTVVPETIRLTNLDQLSTGDVVNLERAIKIGDRISGHYVQGHIDDTGKIIDVYEDGADALIIKISIPLSLEKYIVKKGYIAVDGMSLTIVEVSEQWFSITLIPHTKQVSIANHYCIGKKVNIEVDILGKYVEKLLRKQ